MSGVMRVSQGFWSILKRYILELMKARAVPIRLTAWWHPVLLGLGFYACATAAVLNSKSCRSSR